MDPPETISQQQQQQQQQSKPRRHLHMVVLATIAVVAVLVFVSVVSESESFSLSAVYGRGDAILSTSSTSSSTSSLRSKADGVCASVCRQRRTKRSESATSTTTTTATNRDTDTDTDIDTDTDTNLLDNEELVRRVSAAKDRLFGKLRTDYGDYFGPIFLDGDAPIRPVTPNTGGGGVSLERLKRKLMIKVLTMQLALDEQDADFHGCDCSNGNNKALRDDAMDSLDLGDPSVVFEGIDDNNNNHDNNNNNNNEDDDNFLEKYVWATGGHSAAAGHGNLFNESYTAYMERDLKDVFGSIGIGFEGRNYAMGGTSSATAISMCWKEIFGTDVDLFSWDYGMTDGKDYSKMKMPHYAYRGAMSTSRPAVMMMGYSNAREQRLDVYKTLEEMGLAAFFLNETAMSGMRRAVPDSGALRQDELEALPEYVRNFICNGKIEKGDPFCGKEKYSKWGCASRFKQTSWHPGFKSHALQGHAMALFFVETLLDTLRDLSELKSADDGIPQLLSQLEKEDIELHDNFTTVDLPKDFSNLFSFKDLAGNDATPDIDPSLFFKGPSMCHTARLPSQTRYFGILTDTDEVGKPAPVGEETYFVGDYIRDAETTKAEHQELRLVWEKKKERQKDCTGVIVKPDYSDFFYTNSKDDWTTLTFPNDAEKRAYGYDDPKNKFEGIIVLHFKSCSWGKCQKGFLKAEDFAENLWEMKVNHQVVTNLLVSGGNAVVVEGENGVRFAPDSNGQYTIELKVNTRRGYLEIADFVLY